MRAADVTLAILVGGRGRRLGGRAKGLIRLGDQTILERQLATLRPLVSRVTLIGAGEGYEQLGVDQLPDVRAEKGAPGGVVTALLSAPTRWVLVIACDMPAVSRAMVERLLGARSRGVEVVCFRRAGGAEPLCALYRAALGRRWVTRLDEEPSLRALLETARVVQLRPGAPKRLDSVNTRTDLRRARASFRAKVSAR